MTITTVNYTQTNNQTSFYNTAVFTGTPTDGMTVSQSNTSSTIPSVPFFVINQNSGTTWNVTMGTTTEITTAVNYYATSSQQVLIPQPSTSNRGRIIKITNTSYNPVNITTSSKTNVFGGKYAQIYSTVPTAPTGATLDGFSHLLRAGDTVILKSSGAIWETQEGTSITGVKTFTNNNPTATDKDDRTKKQITLYPLDQTFSNLTGLVLCRNNNSPNFFYLGNTYKYSITVFITATVVWASTTISNSTPPLRLLYLDQGTMDTNGTVISAVNTSPISCLLTNGNFVPTTGVTTQQTVSGTFTLRSGDSVILMNAKINGIATEENITSVTLSVVRTG